MKPCVNLVVVVSIVIAVVIADYNDDLKKISDTIQTINSQLRDLTQQLTTSQSQNDRRRNFVNDLEKKKDEDSSFSNTQMNDLLNAFQKDADSQFNAGVPVLLKYIEERINTEYNKSYYSLISSVESEKALYRDKRKWFYDWMSRTQNNTLKLYPYYAETQTNISASLAKFYTSPEDKRVADAKVDSLQTDFLNIIKQLQADQFHEEEKHRSDGQSGLKQMRTTEVGEKNYYTPTYVGDSIAAIHNHDNHVRTVGMGEFIAVLNGIEFRTRHNDYTLYRAATNSNAYKATEPIPFPNIPPEVIAAGTSYCKVSPGEDCDVIGQVIEMREWFRAFQLQDASIRNYPAYFKPILVYLEGGWTTSSGGKIDEPFNSDRHHIDAESWQDLQEKTRYTSYTGTKSLLENLSHLPTKIIRVTKDNQTVLAQWNYRILCHPISKDLGTNKLKLVKETTAIVGQRMNDQAYSQSRAARYDITGINIFHERDERPLSYTYLDSIMEEIPGLNNYGSFIRPKPFNSPEDVMLSANPQTPDKEVNAAFYYRTFIQKTKEGVRYPRQYGFNDRFYVAHTTQSNIPEVSYTRDDGVTENAAVTYAIPLEVVYLTPLSAWNPYNISYSDVLSNGSGTKGDPYLYAASSQYFLTPSIFFSNTTKDTSTADTTPKGAVMMKTPRGDRAVFSSGVRILFPPIDGLPGVIRQRYPVMPAFAEGSAEYKKLNAIEDSITEPPPPKADIRKFTTGVSHTSANTHDHTVEISEDDYSQLLSGAKTVITAQTSSSIQHFHSLLIKKKADNKLYIADCLETWVPDLVLHSDQVCRDYHQNTLTPEA